jgi:hypothetical protein
MEVAMNKIVLSREEFYNLVWSEPMSSILKKYEISYSELRKILKEMRIPLPEMGYWQKIQYGKPVETKELPIDYSGKEVVTLTIRENPLLFNRSPRKILKEALMNDPSLPTKVNQKLAKPDILVIEARESLTKNKADSNGRHIGLYYSRYKGMVETKRDELSIRVSPANVGRALRFFDAFIKLLRARNHDIIFEYGNTYALIDEEKFEISLREKYIKAKSNDSWQSYEYQPSGIMAFKLESYPYKEWKDGKHLIEDRMTDIFTYFELYAEKRKQERIYYEEQRKIREEKESIESEIRARKEKELRDFKKLVKEANQWQQSQMIRSYISYVEHKAIETGELSDELKNWIDWSKQKADWYDPYKKKDDIILGDCQNYESILPGC